MPNHTNRVNKPVQKNVFAVLETIGRRQDFLFEMLKQMNNVINHIEFVQVSMLRYAMSKSPEEKAAIEKVLKEVDEETQARIKKAKEDVKKQNNPEGVLEESEKPVSDK